MLQFTSATLNPLLMHGSYTEQELREVARNKKNSTIMANYIAKDYCESEGIKDKKIEAIISLMLDTPKGEDILLQRIIQPYSMRVYGNMQEESIGKTIDDLQEFADKQEYFTQRTFLSQAGETHIVLNPLIAFNNTEQAILGEREVLLPLINSKGRERISLTQGGYLTVDLPAILRKKDHHEGTISLDVLNLLQQNMVLHIDEDYFHVVKDPSKNKYERTATLRAVREVLSTKIDDDHRPELRFIAQFDSRGRLYFHAYGINPNGREYLKALFEFEPELLTEEGKEEVIYYIGAMMGYGKDIRDVRYQHALDMIDAIDALYPSMIVMTSRERMQAIYKCVFSEEFYHLYKETAPSETLFEDRFSDTEPYMLIKAIAAYYTGVILNEPVGLIMRQDATSSGLQIMGALDNCFKTLKITNMIDPSKRYDAYMEAFNVLAPHFEDFDKGGKPTQKNVKKAVMTHFYCSKRTPEEVLKNNVGVFLEHIGEIFPAGQKVMDAILSCWSNMDVFQWTYPDNHVARYKPKVMVVGSFEWKNEAGKILDLPFSFYENKKNGKHHHLPANVIQGFDAYVLRQVIRHLNGKVLPNHDEFGTHPNKAYEARLHYHNEIKDIANNDYLTPILRELKPRYRGYRKSNTAKIGDVPVYGLT